MQRGDIWWAFLPEASDSSPSGRRPIIIIQADSFTRSRINTVIVVVLTSNLRLATAPGNVLLSAQATGLPKDSVANVSQLFTVDKAVLTDYVGQLSIGKLRQIEDGLCQILNL